MIRFSVWMGAIKIWQVFDKYPKAELAVDMPKCIGDKYDRERTEEVTECEKCPIIYMHHTLYKADFEAWWRPELESR